MTLVHILSTLHFLQRQIQKDLELIIDLLLKSVYIQAWYEQIVKKLTKVERAET